MALEYVVIVKEVLDYLDINICYLKSGIKKV